jgi:hypothetical protein
MQIKNGSYFSHSWTLFSMVFVLGACSEKNITLDQDRLGLEYFPLEVGQYRIYDVDEIIYNISSFDTLKYELRESVVDSFENSEGSTTYTIRREKRLNDQVAWDLDSVWSARKTNSIAISVENNISLVKMVFPVENGTSWDGNIFNSSGERLFTYDLNVAPITIGSDEFTDLVKVIQSDIPENIVNQDQRFEIYATGIGLVGKNGIMLTFCTVDCPDQKTIIAGRFIDQRLKSYGQE